MEIFIFFVFALLMIPLVIWHFSRSRDVLDHWAQSHGYRIIEANYSHLKGPFFWTSSRGQSVYRVVVEDANGQRRTGWVRCGSWLWGIWSDTAEVRWDE